jgi:hypothetical protein
MKRIFAVALLLLSLASASWADGAGPKPPVCPGGVLCAAGGTTTKPSEAAVVLWADGPGQKPPAGGMAADLSAGSFWA